MPTKSAVITKTEWQVRARQLQRFYHHEPHFALRSIISDEHLTHASAIFTDYAFKQDNGEEDWPKKWEDVEGKRSLQGLLRRPEWKAQAVAAAASVTAARAARNIASADDGISQDPGRAGATDNSAPHDAVADTPPTGSNLSQNASPISGEGLVSRLCRAPKENTAGLPQHEGSPTPAGVRAGGAGAGSSPTKTGSSHDKHKTAALSTKSRDKGTASPNHRATRPSPLVLRQTGKGPQAAVLESRGFARRLELTGRDRSELPRQRLTTAPRPQRQAKSAQAKQPEQTQARTAKQVKYRSPFVEAVESGDDDGDGAEVPAAAKTQGTAAAQSSSDDPKPYHAYGQEDVDKYLQFIRRMKRVGKELATKAGGDAGPGPNFSEADYGMYHQYQKNMGEKGGRVHD